MAQNFNFHCVFGITSTFIMQEKIVHSDNSEQTRLSFLLKMGNIVLFTFRRVKLWLNNLGRKKKAEKLG